MYPLVVRDLRGDFVGYLDGDALRDENGKPVAFRSKTDGDAPKLAGKAATWMSGRSVLMASATDLSPLDVSTAATQYDYGIPSLECVADRVSQVQYVKHKSGVIYAENVADAVAPPGGSNGDDGLPPRIDPGYTPATFTTVGFGLCARIPRLVGANADFDLQARAMRRIVEGLRLLREIRLAKILMTLATFATANQISVIAKWNGGTNPSPLTDVMGALAASYLPANAIVLSENVSQFYYAQPTGDTANQIRDFVQSGGQLPTPIIARAKMLVGGNPKYVWSQANPTHVPLVRISTPDTIPTTRTLRWLGEDGVRDGERVDGMLVRKFTDKATDSDVIVVAHDDIEQIVSNQVGAIISGALQ